MSLEPSGTDPPPPSLPLPPPPPPPPTSPPPSSTEPLCDHVASWRFNQMPLSLTAARAAHVLLRAILAHSFPDAFSASSLSYIIQGNRCGAVRCAHCTLDSHHESGLPEGRRANAVQLAVVHSSERRRGSKDKYRLISHVWEGKRQRRHTESA